MNVNEYGTRTGYGSGPGAQVSREGGVSPGAGGAEAAAVALDGRRVVEVETSENHGGPAVAVAVPRIEEPDDVPEFPVVQAAVPGSVREPDGGDVPADDGYAAKAHILMLREWYPEKVEWIDAMVNDLGQQGIPVQEISGIVDGEIAKVKPQIIKERKDRLAQIRDPKKRKDIVPKNGLEQRVMDSRSALGAEKKSPPDCGVA